MYFVKNSYLQEQAEFWGRGGSGAGRCLGNSEGGWRV